MCMRQEKLFFGEIKRGWYTGSILEISQKVGYENEKHFMKLFKSQCGVSSRNIEKICSSANSKLHI